MCVCGEGRPPTEGRGLAGRQREPTRRCRDGASAFTVWQRAMKGVGTEREAGGMGGVRGDREPLSILPKTHARTHVHTHSSVKAKNELVVNHPGAK